METKQEKDKRALDADLKALRDYIDEINPSGYGQAKRTRLLHALERIAERLPLAGR